MSILGVHVVEREKEGIWGDLLYVLRIIKLELAVVEKWGEAYPYSCLLFI